MDDLSFGKRNKRGAWAPDGWIETAPVFTLPPKPVAFLKWLPHYFLPRNVLFAASAVAYWHLIVPELRLYILRTQENRFKHNGKFPGDNKGLPVCKNLNVYAARVENGTVLVELPG
ncbi:hypothetical protein HJB51_25860 [Rhizobium lentis]|nr:hypothetical protein [Rhizobium lentis]MBX5056457.1 hypothetical protein [Rhizobium lentis]MBX5075199.1 hypothetical protein [Rhizobium lentis]MBX5111372.1 hypothetical protein [Rhizobium lentis]MBX5114338.1 hypothetical protein [Rhizobium lentis]